MRREEAPSSAWAKYAAIAMNVLFPALALGFEPMFMMVSVLCADVYSCAGVLVALPLLATVPFAIVSVILLMRRRVAAAFVACGPIVEAAAIVYYLKARWDILSARRDNEKLSSEHRVAARPEAFSRARLSLGNGCEEKRLVDRLADGGAA